MKTNISSALVIMFSILFAILFAEITGKSDERYQNKFYNSTNIVLIEKDV